jgi:uncharacterized protein
MELEHTFTVPTGADEAFRILRDIERIAPCMPGATITSVEGDEFEGKVKVKVGPIQVTYQGRAAFVDVDESARTATIEAKGKEARGTGTANATIRAACVEKGDQTEVRVTTELAITGKPAQFGRGVMADVGDKLLGRFADCLAEQLTAGEEGGSGEPLEDRAPDAEATAVDPSEARVEPASGNGAVGGVTAPSSGLGSPAVAPTATKPGLQRSTDDAVDLLEVAGGPIAKRAAPVVAGLALLALIIWLIRRG